MTSQIGRVGAKKPCLTDYDNAKPRAPSYGISQHLPSDVVYGAAGEGADHSLISRWVGADDWSNQGLIKQLHHDRSWEGDRALLREAGVDGTVCFETAARNAGLTIVAPGHAKRLAAANDDLPAEATVAA